MTTGAYTCNLYNVDVRDDSGSVYYVDDDRNEKFLLTTMNLFTEKVVFKNMKRSIKIGMDYSNNYTKLYTQYEQVTQWASHLVSAEIVDTDFKIEEYETSRNSFLAAIYYTPWNENITTSNLLQGDLGIKFVGDVSFTGERNLANIIDFANNYMEKSIQTYEQSIILKNKTLLGVTKNTNVKFTDLKTLSLIGAYDWQAKKQYGFARWKLVSDAGTKLTIKNNFLSSPLGSFFADAKGLVEIVNNEYTDKKSVYSGFVTVTNIHTRYNHRSFKR